MQISRHWRMNAQRYRLEGVRYNDGEVNLQARPRVEATEDENETADTTTDEDRQLRPVKVSAA